MSTSENASTGTPEPKIGGYPWTDWRLPPAGGTEVKYTARYHHIVSRHTENRWWDLVALYDTPEEVVEAMARQKPGVELYVIYKVTVTEEIVDVSRMGYEPGDPHFKLHTDTGV